jgi:hypothetical protein
MHAINECIHKYIYVLEINAYVRYISIGKYIHIYSNSKMNFSCLYYALN